MMKKHVFNRSVLFTLASLLAHGLGLASAHAGALHLRYEAHWGGLHVADFSLSLMNDTNQDGATFENDFHLETRGLTRFITKMAVTANSRGRIVSPPPPRNEDDPMQSAVSTAAGAHLVATYLADKYHTEYTNRRHFRWVDIVFGQAGEPAHASTGTSPIKGREDKWNPAEKGPEVLEKVEESYRTGVNDPITMIPQMMAMVRTHMSGGPASTVAKGFDGRRRFDMDITYLGLATRTIGKIKHDTYHVRVVPNPVAGFKKRHKALWNGSSYDFYLSRDGRFVPLQIVPVEHGPVLTMVAECTVTCEIKPEED